MSSKAHLRVGSVGTGFIRPAHVEALRRLGIEVVGVAGSSPERAAPKAQPMRILKLYAKFDDMIANPRITTLCGPLLSYRKWRLQQQA